MRTLWHRYSGWTVGLVFALGFSAGMAFGGWPSAEAQQEFDRENLKSVPESFLKGGDRSYTALRSIVDSTAAAAKSLTALERDADGADKRHRALMNKLTGIETQLQKMNKLLQDEI